LGGEWHTKPRLRHAPMLVTTPARCLFSLSSIDGIVRRLEQVHDPLGVLTLATSSLDGDVYEVQATTTRAFRRGERAAADHGPVAEAGRQFGEWWASGADFGVTAYHRPAATSEKDSEGKTDHALDETDVAKKVVANLTPRQRELLINLAQKGVRTLVTLEQVKDARSLRGRLSTLRSAGGIWTPMAVRRCLYQHVYPHLRRLRGSSSS